LLGRIALAIVLFAVGVFGVLSLGQPPAARAASQGSVFVFPSAGGPGTRVQLELHFFGDPQLYIIKVAVTSTADGGCDHALTLPGDGGKPVQLGGQDATKVEFDWPASLASNAYYFCVFPAAYPTSAPTATATATAIGTPASSPVATATPKPAPTPTAFVTGPNQGVSQIPFVYTRDAGAKVALPAQSNAPITAGAQVQVTLTNWLSRNRAAPTSVTLTQVGQQDSPNQNAPISAQFTVTTPPDSKGNCVLNVTIPQSLGSGSDANSASQPYLMVVGGPGIYQRSDPITVAPAVSPTVAVSPTPTRRAGQSGGGGLLQVLGWVVAILAFLGAIGGVLYLALNSSRRAQQAKAPQPSAPWGGPQQNSWGGPQGNLWGDSPDDSWGAGPSNWGQGPQGSRPDWDAPTQQERWPGERP
jgi:hypothetical protein